MQHCPARPTKQRQRESVLGDRTAPLRYKSSASGLVNLLPSVYAGRAHGHTRTDGRRLPNGVWVMSGNEFILSDQASPSVGLGMGNDQPIKWVSRPCLPNGDFRDDRERVGVRIVPLISYNLIQIFKPQDYHRRKADCRLLECQLGI